MKAPATARTGERLSPIAVNDLCKVGLPTVWAIRRNAQFSPLAYGFVPICGPLAFAMEAPMSVSSDIGAPISSALARPCSDVSSKRLENLFRSKQDCPCWPRFRMGVCSPELPTPTLGSPKVCGCCVLTVHHPYPPLYMNEPPIDKHSACFS